MTAPLVLFAHGKESGPWGTKIEFLANIARASHCQVLSPDYGAIPDADDRVKHLLSIALPAHSQLILVGSSMGGYVSALASTQLKPAGLFLMAPAFYHPSSQEQNPKTGADHTCIVSGWDDEIIPIDASITFARKWRCELHILDGDHRLISVLPKVGSLFSDFLKTVIDKTKASIA